MTEYSFERFSMLVVEDNSYLSSLLMQGLRALGVGQIRTARHGGEAIELLQLVKAQPGKAGVMSIDLILSNWLMSPVDGMMLLRWVRRHKDSPNRFVPFIMVTGYADRERVRQARDMGVTEMLTKPFSVQSITQRIVQVIERPRQFVHAPSYFGPDRRRQDLGPPGGEERRVTREDEIEVVYGER
jgi:two-component system, chemotaxis family, chemotaxis protein CheY